MSSQSDRLGPPASPSASQTPSSPMAKASSQHGTNNVTMSLPPSRVLPSSSERRGSSGNFFCAAGCPGSFKSHSNLKDHIMNVHQIFPADRVVLRCTRGCGKGFTRKSDFQKHIERKTRCDEDKPNSASVNQQRPTLSLEQGAKLLACVQDVKIPKLHRQQPKSGAATTVAGGSNAKLEQLSPTRCDTIPTQALTVTGNEHTDHIQQSPGMERSVAVSSYDYQDQSFNEKPYIHQSIEHVSQMERNHLPTPTMDRISYRQPQVPVQSNIASEKQTYSMDPVPQAASLAPLHLQSHPYQLYWNEYTRQPSTYTPHNVEMRQYHPALTVDHQVFATHQPPVGYSLFGQAQTLQVFSQQLPASEQPPQSTDTLHSLTLPRSLVAAVGSAPVEMPTSVLYNRTLPGIDFLSRPFRPSFDREGGSENPVPYSNGESSDSGKNGDGRSTGTVANGLTVASKDLPWTPQSCAPIQPPAPFVLSSERVQSEEEWANLVAAVNRRHSRYPPTQLLPTLPSINQPVFPLPAPSKILQSTSTPRMQRVRNAFHARHLSQDTPSSVMPPTPTPYSSYAAHYNEPEHVSDRDAESPASPSRGRAAGDARKRKRAKGGKEEVRSSTVISLETDPDPSQPGDAESQTNRHLRRESGSFSSVNEWLLQSGIP